MPITNAKQGLSSARQLELPDTPNARFYILFIGSVDPETGLSWCPDVRAALPVVTAVFEQAHGPELMILEVGQKAEWKDPANIYRANWNIEAIPTLSRFQRVGGEVAETGRMVENELLDSPRLASFKDG